jgi:hypothetical protein
MERMEG